MIYLLVPKPPKNKKVQPHLKAQEFFFSVIHIPTNTRYHVPLRHRFLEWTTTKTTTKTMMRMKKGESSFSLRETEQGRVCAGSVRNEHVLSLENVPSVEKMKRLDIGILVREAGGRWLLLSVGTASVHGRKEFLH